MSQPYPPQIPEDPASDFTPADTSKPYDPRLTLDPGRFIAGAIATALVAALVGLIGVVIIEGVFDQTMVLPPNLFSSDSHGAVFAVDSALFALLASGVLALLVVSTPRPKRFFGWLMILAIALVTLLPFAWTSHTDRAILTALVNFIMGIATWSLLAGVATRTIRAVPAPGTPPTQQAPPGYPPSVPPVR